MSENRINNYLTIGNAAKRCGVATSTLRFYESRNLISSIRGPGNQRRYHRAMIRRISLIRVAQGLGVSLTEIGDALQSLPKNRTPTRRDWEKLSREWGARLDRRIQSLQAVRNQLSSCIGCGCLSLDRCALYNSGDHVAQEGSGAVLLEASVSSKDAHQTD